VPDAVRTELASAHAAYTAAARLVGWTALYAVLGLLWWPAAGVAAVLAATAFVQSRAAAVTLADLSEATVDLYGTDLATHLRIQHTDTLSPETGWAITAALRKGHIPAPAQPAPLARRVGGQVRRRDNQGDRI
jgi:hypothetical protein